MVPALPAELLSIIHHSLPPSLTSTHASRITQLCTLSLVSPTFRAFAQPLLLTEVHISKPRQLRALLKVLRARGGGERVKRVFVSLPNTRERSGSKVQTLEKAWSEAVPALLVLCENVEEIPLAWMRGEEVCKALAKANHLHPLHLLCSLSHPSTPTTLPILRLTLYRPPGPLLSALLSPTVLPSLYSLSLQETPLDAPFTTLFPLLAPRLTTLHLAQLPLRETAFPTTALTSLRHLAVDDIIVLPSLLSTIPGRLASLRLLTPWKDPYALTQDLHRLAAFFVLPLPPSIAQLEELVIPASEGTEGRRELWDACGRVRVGERRVETFVTVAAGRVVVAACEDWDAGFEREGGE